MDYRNDNSFVREVPAVFELVEQCYRQYLWTGNPEYLTNGVLSEFCAKAVTDFIRLHDTRIPNGVAEGDGSGNIFRGVATYNEIHSPMIEAGDGIACQYQALLSYSELLALLGDEKSKVFSQKASQLKSFFNTAWGVTNTSDLFIRGYDVRGRALTDFGKENSWFIPMKFITEASPRNDRYLDFIAASVDTKEGRPSNIEAISYLPGVFFPYNRVTQAWKWMEYIIDQENKEYPEISFVLIDNVVTGLMGICPNAPANSVSTISRLPQVIERLEVRHIPFGQNRISVKHESILKTTLTHIVGSKPLRWEAQFYGDQKMIEVNGKQMPASHKKVHGVDVSWVEISVPVGATITASVVLK